MLTLKCSFNYQNSSLGSDLTAFYNGHMTILLANCIFFNVKVEQILWYNSQAPIRPAEDSHGP